METKKVQSRDGRVDQCAGLESLSLLVGGVGSNPTPGAHMNIWSPVLLIIGRWISITIIQKLIRL